MDWLSQTFGDITRLLGGGDSSGQINLGDAGAGVNIHWGAPRVSLGMMLVLLVAVFLLARR
ncbi:MAG TPA: hypothetical protein VFL93_07135 [Longimicrobiaceae bacterium]|nr:hypothetical protein [Longimicrobiaceae bacterium]